MTDASPQAKAHSDKIKAQGFQDLSVSHNADYACAGQRPRQPRDCSRRMRCRLHIRWRLARRLDSPEAYRRELKCWQDRDAPPQVASVKPSAF